MELPQSMAVEAKGGRTTPDVLSLYASSPSNQDPMPQQGSLVVTHDFLQRLERVGAMAREDNFSVMSAIGNHPPWPAQCTTIDPVFPGGIGSYSIAYIGQRVSEIDRNALVAARANSAAESDESSFKLWDESAFVKGKTGKEKVATGRNILPDRNHVVLTTMQAGMDTVGGEWAYSSSWSPSNQKNTSAPLSSVSSLLPLPSKKKQSFIEMITAAKNDRAEDEDKKESTIKKETLSHSQLKGDLSVNLEHKTMNQKSNTIRSKHSATEQRRRSKINDRFQKLREVIPNSEQKKDKASFLLEVIEYIQFLQERVNRFEGQYTRWNHESAKMMPWRNDHVAEGFVDDKQGVDIDFSPGPVPAMAFDVNKGVLPSNGQNLSDSDLTTAKTKLRDQPELESTPKGTGGSYADKTMPWNPLQSQQNRASGPEDISSNVESGRISISSTYSQGLLRVITEALQRSGVDLSESRISVKINLGKRSNGSSIHSSATKETDRSTGDDMGLTLKKQKTAK